MNVFSEIKQNVKRVIKALLVASPKGMDEREINREYMELEGTRLPCARLGFSCAEDLLKSFSDILSFRMQRCEGRTQIIYTCKEADEDEHVWRMVKEQKNFPTKISKIEKGNKGNFVPAEIQNNVMSILRVSNDWIDLTSFCNLYMQKFGSLPSLRNLGFVTMEALLKTMLLKTIEANYGNNKTLYISAINDENYKQEMLNSDKLQSEHVPNFVIDSMEKLLKEHTDGIRVELLIPLYKNLTGKDLNVYSLGYSSVLELILSLGSIFKINTTKNNDYYIISAKDVGVLQTMSPHVPVSKTQSSLNKQCELIKSSVNKISKTPSTQNRKCELAMSSEIKLNKFVQVGESFNQVNVRKAHEEDGWLEIEIAEVYSPLLFWAHLRDNNMKLGHLMADMMEFYTQPEVLEKYRINFKDCSMEMPVVSLYEKDNNFYRAVVKNFKSFDKIEVFYVDYGSNVQIHRKNVWFLDRQFFDLPTQAFQARLSGITPSLPGHRWVNGTSKRFLQLVENRPLCARLLGMKGLSWEVELVDTTSDECDVYINEKLVIEQYAICQDKPQMDTLYEETIPSVEGLSTVLTPEYVIQIRDSDKEKTLPNSTSQQDNEISLSKTDPIDYADSSTSINECISQLQRERSTILKKLCEEPESAALLNRVTEINDKIKKFNTLKDSSP